MQVRAARTVQDESEDIEAALGSSRSSHWGGNHMAASVNATDLGDRRPTRLAALLATAMLVASCYFDDLAFWPYVLNESDAVVLMELEGVYYIQEDQTDPGRAIFEVAPSSNLVRGPTVRLGPPDGAIRVFDASCRLLHGEPVRKGDYLITIDANLQVDVEQLTDVPEYEIEILESRPGHCS